MNLKIKAENKKRQKQYRALSLSYLEQIKNNPGVNSRNHLRPTVPILSKYPTAHSATILNVILLLFDSRNKINFCYSHPAKLNSTNHVSLISKIRLERQKLFYFWDCDSTCG